MQARLEVTLKTRIPAYILLVVSLLAAVWTGWHLRQALEIDHELRGQMADLALVASTAPNHPTSSIVTTGEASLRTALTEVIHDGHKLELWLAVEGVGLLIALSLLRRQPR